MKHCLLFFAVSVLTPLLWGGCGPLAEDDLSPREAASACHEINRSFVRLRRSPGTNAQDVILANLDQGTRVTLLPTPARAEIRLDQGETFVDGPPRQVLAADMCWRYVRVTVDGVVKSGWVAEQFISDCTPASPSPGSTSIPSCTIETLFLSGALNGAQFLLPVNYCQGLPRSYFDDFPNDLMWIPNEVLHTSHHSFTYKVAHNIRLRGAALGAYIAWVEELQTQGWQMVMSWRQGPNCAFRTYEYQDSIDHLVNAARAGHSEHHLGTAIDIDFLSARPDQQWLAEMARSFGFVQSYPDSAWAGYTPITGYPAGMERQHFRFIGTQAAARHQELQTSTGRYLAAPDFIDQLTPHDRIVLENAIRSEAPDQEYERRAARALCADLSVSTCLGREEDDARSAGLLLVCAGKDFSGAYLRRCSNGCVRAAVGSPDSCAER